MAMAEPLLQQPLQQDLLGNIPMRMDVMNLITILMFYSPIIIAVFILSISFVSQNFKGLIYLACLKIGLQIIINDFYKF